MNGGGAVLCIIGMIGLCMAGAETPDAFWPWLNFAGIGITALAAAIGGIFS